MMIMKQNGLQKLFQERLNFIWGKRVKRILREQNHGTRNKGFSLHELLKFQSFLMIPRMLRSAINKLSTSRYNARVAETCSSVP